MLWPQTRRAAVLTAAGLGVAVPALTDLVRQWESAGARSEDTLSHEARELAAAIRAGWPKHPWERKHASDKGHAASVLAALSRLGDLEGGAAFIAQRSAGGAYGAADNAALAGVLGQLPADRGADLLTAVIATNVAGQPGACAGLLAHCAQAGGERLASLRAPALTLLAGLPDGPEPSQVPTADAASPSPQPWCPIL